jgi:hypothetical protein
MRVKAIRNKFEDCPSVVAAFGFPESQIQIVRGEEYDVFALSVFQGVVFLQVLVDTDHIIWLPAWFFDVCDPTVPNDWRCIFPTGDLQMVLGPDFVAADEDSYNNMVELHPESVAAFWRRFDAKTQASE